MTILRHTFKESSMLLNAYYDTDEKEMTVTFINGRSYTYENVPKDVYEELTTTKSAGRYFNTIKGMLKIK